jgi:hypothetical protein
MIAHDAFSALVNLSDAAMVQKELSDDDFLVFLTSYIIVRLAFLPSSFLGLSQRYIHDKDGLITTLRVCYRTPLPFSPPSLLCSSPT